MDKRSNRGGQDSASRRGFLAAGIATGLAVAVSQAGAKDDSTFDLLEKDIDDLQNGLKAGKYTSRKLVELYLERIKAIDQNGPTLRSVIEINPDALKLADALDRERKEKGSRGPLHGIPILIKDNIDTADRMATTAGSLALVGAKPARDAFLVRQLRNAGVVLLGKTNLSEWANARSSHSTSGWSGRGGQTRNPYALDRNPSGSSSGSGVAVAASLCAAAIGTETNGSIISPSSVNGLVGVKPTVGLVSRSGVIPISHTQDTAGPMTRTVRDAAYVLTAMAGFDKDDTITEKGKAYHERDYSKYLQVDGLKGARIGVARNFFGFHEKVDPLIEAALLTMKRQGAILIDTKELPEGKAYGHEEMIVLTYEMKADLNRYLARLGPKSPVKSIEDVIAFNDKNAAKELPYFGQDWMIKMAEAGSLESKVYRKALETCLRETREKGIDAVVKKHRLDAIVAPCCAPASLTDLVNGDSSEGGGDIISVAAVAGYPNITVPAGFLFGLPVGICFVGPAWSEPTLFKLAYAFEQATKVRKPPRFLPSVELGK